MNKIRLTGGEPTLRPDIVQLTQRLHELPGSPAIGITTNAIALKRRLAELQASGEPTLHIRKHMQVLSGTQEAGCASHVSDAATSCQRLMASSIFKCNG